MDATMMSPDLALADLLRHGAVRHPGSLVVEYRGPDREPTERTFADVGADCVRLAAALAGLGVGPGERVATLSWNTTEHLVAYLAIPSMGAVLHTLNLRLTDEQLVFVLRQAGDRVVLVDHTLAGQLERLLPDAPDVRHVIVAGGEPEFARLPEGVTAHALDALLAAAPDEFAWAAVDERSAASLCYTTGTTGDPKGVAYSHRSIWLHTLTTSTASVLGFTDRDRVLPIVPMFHVNAWGWPFGAWLAGADLVLAGRHLRPADLAQILATQRPTLAAAVPTIWNDLVRYGRDHPLDLSSLRLGISGGSALSRALASALRDEHGVRLAQGWGMTETSPVAAISVPPRAATDGGDEVDWLVRSGRLLPGVEARIVDDAGAALPQDGTTVGEIELRGHWVTGGYAWSEATDRFHDGWLRTGDTGRIAADGWVAVTDRVKDAIKSGGEWISSVELENHLAEHPDVVEAAVVAVPDPRWDERPLACVVLTAGTALDPAALRTFLAERVPRWWLPEAFASVDALPRTSVGKSDKKALRAAHAAGRLELHLAPLTGRGVR